MVVVVVVGRRVCVVVWQRPGAWRSICLKRVKERKIEMGMYQWTCGCGGGGLVVCCPAGPGCCCGGPVWPCCLCVIVIAIVKVWVVVWRACVAMCCRHITWGKGNASVKKVGVPARSSCSGAAGTCRNAYFFYRCPESKSEK